MTGLETSSRIGHFKHGTINIGAMNNGARGKVVFCRVFLQPDECQGLTTAKTGVIQYD